MDMSPHVSIRQARDHINSIRSDKGLDGPKKNPKLVLELERALQVIANELYQESTHFLSELIQNADDNSYSPDVEPSLEFTLQRGSLQVDCNELGFQPSNVESICKTGFSTKSGKVSGAAQQIGEKGIGFKSVFRVASVVWILSGSYSFKFDKNETLGMVAPIWDDNFPGKRRPGYTSFFLELQTQCNVWDLARDLLSLEGKSLIFLHKLTRIKVGLLHAPNPQMSELEVIKEVDPVSKTMITTLRKDKYHQKFLVYDKVVENLPQVEVRAGGTSTVSIAIPLTADNQPDIQPQYVFAFLPIRDYGFKFLINADFVLTATRQDIFLSNPWNEQLAIGCIHAISETFQKLALHPPFESLRYTWVRYLPVNLPHGTVFSKPLNSFWSQLVTIPLIVTQEDKAAPGSGLWFIPQDFREENGQPLTLNASTAGKYASLKYAGEDTENLRHLGVIEMNIISFLHDLKLTLEDPPRKKSYLGALSRVLIKHLDSDTCMTMIREMHIIRVRGGQFVSSTSGDIFFPSDEGRVEIPEGLNAMIVAPQYAKHPDIRLLYTALGAKKMSAGQVCHLIIATHSSQEFEASEFGLEILISHAQFLYAANFTNKSEASKLVVVTDEGNYVRASRVYQIAPGEYSAVYFFGQSSACHFLHPDYFKNIDDRNQKFSLWLTTSMNIWAIPRLVHQVRSGRFSLTDEFRWLLQPESNIPSRDVLTLLRDFWELTYARWLPSTYDGPSEAVRTSITKLRQELSFFMVDCHGGKKVPLCQSYIPHPDWMRWQQQMPLLDIPEPENPMWKFLQELGVSTKGASFYLQCLQTLALQFGPPDGLLDDVSSLYNGVADWVGDDPASVRKAFELEPLIYVPSEDASISGRWINVQDCTWDGPQLRHFTSIANYYPSHTRLFRDILRISDLEIEHIMTEIDNFRSNEDIHYVAYIWDFVKFWMNKKGKVVYDTLTRIKLTSAHAFPVVIGKTGGSNSISSHVLKSARSEIEWFIPDTEELFDAFRGKVPYLAFDLDTIQKLKDVFELLGLQRRFLGNIATRDSIIEGPPKRDAHYTKLLLTTKVQYLLRLVPENCQDRKLILESLQKLSVFSAPSIKERLSVIHNGKIVSGTPVQTAVALVEKDRNVSITIKQKYLEKKMYYEFYPELADRLTSYCHVDDKFNSLVLLIISEKNSRIIDKQFAKYGIRRLTPEETITKETYFQNFTKGEADDRTAASRSRIEALAEGYKHAHRKVKIYNGGKRPPGSSRKTSISSNATINSSNKYSALSEFLGSDDSDDDIIYYLESDSSDYSSSDVDSSSGEEEEEEEEEASLVLITKGSSKLEKQRKRKRRRRAVPEVDEELAARAEFWASCSFNYPGARSRELTVFKFSKYLEAILGMSYNALEHWTSHRRTHAGLAPIPVADYECCTSSFTIPDVHGAFSKFLSTLDETLGKRSLSKPPTYHIEVVSTRRGPGSPFFMRNEWWKMAQKHSLLKSIEERSSTDAPRNVCILALVYRMETDDQNVMFVPDPWRWFTQYKISMEAEGMYVGRVRGTGS